VTTPPTRRSFLAAAAAAPVLGSVATGFPANETVNVGVIGSGGRARQLMKALARVENVRLTAVCDVWDVALEEGRKLADPKAVVTKKYQELLDNKDVHAVLIGTPDHWHVPLTVAACQAGKDVYVEKPLTHKLSEGQAVIDAQNRHKRIVQVGTQQRSMPHIAEAKALIKAGAIGQVFKVTMSWNRNTNRVKRFPLGVKPEQVDWKAFLGNAPAQPFDEYRMRNWRWYWDFGGGLFTDLMVHWVDVAHWLLDLDTVDKHPLKAVSVGEFVAAKDVWETPDTVQTLLSYPGGLQMHYEGTFSNARRGAHIEFMGTEASLYVDRGRFEVIPERGKKAEPRKEIVAAKPDYPGADFYDKPDGELLHVQNWIECVRSRKAPTAPAEAGVTGAAAAHLSNIALRTSQTAVWMG
jgi:predicted dehydrogenase